MVVVVVVVVVVVRKRTGKGLGARRGRVHTGRWSHAPWHPACVALASFFTEEEREGVGVFPPY